MQAEASSAVSWPQTMENIYKSVLSETEMKEKCRHFVFFFQKRCMNWSATGIHARIKWIETSRMTHHSLGWSSWGALQWCSWGSAYEGGQDGGERPLKCPPLSRGVTIVQRNLMSASFTWMSETIIWAVYKTCYNTISWVLIHRTASVKLTLNCHLIKPQNSSQDINGRGNLKAEHLIRIYILWNVAPHTKWAISVILWN